MDINNSEFLIINNHIYSKEDVIYGLIFYVFLELEDSMSNEDILKSISKKYNDNISHYNTSTGKNVSFSKNINSKLNFEVSKKVNSFLPDSNILISILEKHGKLKIIYLEGNKIYLNFITLINDRYDYLSITLMFRSSKL